MNCKIKTTTVQTDFFEISLYDHLGSLEELEIQISELGQQGETIRAFSEGTITTRNGYTYINYIDSEEMDTNKSKTKISFKNDTPDEIFVSRSGGFNSELMFSKGKACHGVLNTPLASFEYIIRTKEVKNKLYSDNYLEIIYYLQVKGAQVEKTFLRIEVEK